MTQQEKDEVHKALSGLTEKQWERIESLIASVCISVISILIAYIIIKFS